MANCDLEKCESFSITTQSSADIDKVNKEILWGLSYRDHKQREKLKAPIPPKGSPINIPFKICRDKQLKGYMKKKKLPIKFGIVELKSVKRKKTKKTKDKSKPPKISLLDRSVMSQSKYMAFLAIPAKPPQKKPVRKKKKKVCCRCELEPCPPRIIQLSVPNKRLVYENWKSYYQSLPAEVILRFEQILHTNQSLEPKEARQYFKNLDKLKRKALREKRKLKKKLLEIKARGDQKWLFEEIEKTADVIVNFVKDEPLFSLNYKQMMLSDALLDKLNSSRIVKKPSRKTTRHYKKSTIEISDKIAVWMDTLTRFVDVQAVESDEDIRSLELSSLESEGEESTYSLEEEVEAEDEELEEGKEWGEDLGEEGRAIIEGMTAEKIEGVMGDLFGGESGTDLMHLTDDILERLIAILSHCSDDFLEQVVDPETMPGIRYLDILDKLKELRDGRLRLSTGKPFLEQAMIDWALKNDPDNVDDKILEKIRETAAILQGLFRPGSLGLGAKVPTGTETEGGITTDEALTPIEELLDKEDEYSGLLDQMEGGSEVMTDLGDIADEGPGEEEPMSIIELEGDDDLTHEDEDLTREDEDLTREDEYLTREEEELVGGEEQEEALSIYFGLEDDMLFGGEEGFEIPQEFIAQKGEAGGILPSATFGKEEKKEEEREEYNIEAERALEEDLRVIKGHKPPVVFEHSPDTVCCLSLKIWAVWLLEITHNAHNWTLWIGGIIRKVREYAAIVRGDVKLPDGKSKILYKSEWRKFMKETEEQVVAWRQYSAHVKELSQKIMDNYSGKKVNCCPKCLQDHLIKNVVVAHDTLQALTDGMNCAGYWQRTLDALVDQTAKLTCLEEEDEKSSSSSSDSGPGMKVLEDFYECICPGRKLVSEESISIIEEIDLNELSPFVQSGTSQKPCQSTCIKQDTCQYYWAQKNKPEEPEVPPKDTTKDKEKKDGKKDGKKDDNKDGEKEGKKDGEKGGKKGGEKGGKKDGEKEKVAPKAKKKK